MPRRDSIYSAYIAKVRGYLKNRLLAGLRFIHWEKYARKNSVVFVKPNFTYPRHVAGVTTTPELLKHLLGIIKERSSTVIVGESDGGNKSYRAEDAFRGHKMYEICKDIGVELVNLSRLPSRSVESKVQGRTIRMQLPKMLLEQVDCFISVPVLKVHVVTGVSLGLKNLWGCNPDTMRGLYHRDLGYKLAFMARLLNPRIVVIDGLYALDGHGPMFGNPIKMDLVMTSDNIVVADSLGTKIVGIPLRMAKHILVAEDEEIGTADLRRVKVNTNWNQYRRQFHIERTLLDRISILTFNSHIISKLGMDSCFTPLIYKIVDRLRSQDEKEVAKLTVTERKKTIWGQRRRAGRLLLPNKKTSLSS